MPVSDRLSQLLRQRALVQEQLVWLDREIADASVGAASPAAIPVARTVMPVAPQAAAIPAPSHVSTQAAALLQQPLAPAVPTATNEVLPAADEILEQYRVAPDAMKTDVRKGCLIYFFGALALLALGVVVLYYALHHGE